MAKNLKIAITFGEVDEDIYDFLKSQKNASSLVRKLVERYMLTGDINSSNSSNITSQPKATKTEDESEQKIDKQFTKEEIIEEFNLNEDDENLNSLKDLGFAYQ